jgi:ligand-binding sensor domain-containing protein
LSSKKHYSEIKKITKGQTTRRYANWDIDQDQNGAMYFANNDGLLQFDGTEWHKYSVPSNSDVKSVEIDSSGKIYIGSYIMNLVILKRIQGKLVTIHYPLTKKW